MRRGDVIDDHTELMGAREHSFENLDALSLVYIGGALAIPRIGEVGLQVCVQKYIYIANHKQRRCDILTKCE